MWKTGLIGVTALTALLGWTAPNARANGSSADVVFQWNQILQATLPATIGPTSPRYYSMLHIAMFDAINSIEWEVRAVPSAVPAPCERIA